jgi:hypothetical protein
MKIVVIIVFFTCIFPCNAQIYSDLKGCWLPENYITALLEKDTINSESFLLPVEGFEIFMPNTLVFINNYKTECQNIDTNKLILIKTYKSELNSILTQMIIEDGIEKYQLPYFFSYLNLKFISSELLNHYQNSVVYIFNKDNKLYLDITCNKQNETIIFINNVNGYNFKNIIDAQTYLYNIHLILKE